MKARNTKTRHAYQSFFARNSLFDPDFSWDNLYIYKNPTFTAYECSKVEDICKSLSNSVDRARVEEYLNGFIVRGGVEYLECAKQHISDVVLPRVVALHRSALTLEKQEHGRWQEHIKVVSKEYTSLSVNLVILKDCLSQYAKNNADVMVQASALGIR